MKKIIILLLFSMQLIASPFVKPSEPSGILKLNQSHPSADIFPVSIFSVDGKQVNIRNNAVWLTPGNHTIRVHSTINLDSRSSALITRQKANNAKQNNTLELTIEDGKTYYVGYDASDRNPNKWRPVVWKTK